MGRLCRRRPRDPALGLLTKKSAQPFLERYLHPTIIKTTSDAKQPPSAIDNGCWVRPTLGTRLHARLLQLQHLAVDKVDDLFSLHQRAYLTFEITLLSTAPSRLMPRLLYVRRSPLKESSGVNSGKVTSFATWDADTQLSRRRSRGQSQKL